MKKTYNVNKLAIFLFLVGCLMGMDLTALGVFLNGPQFLNAFGRPTPIEQGLLMGANPLGGLIGSIFYVNLSKTKGRINLFQISSLIWFVGAVVGTVVAQIWMIALARLIKGVTIGMLSILVTSYISELFPSQIRGRTLAFVQVGYTFSILSMHFLCVACDLIKSQLSFRLAWGLECLPAIIVYAITYWIPESPFYLIISGNYEQAEFEYNSMARRYNKNCNENDTQTKELNNFEIVEHYGCTEQPLTYMELLKKNSRNYVFMGCLLQIMVQCTGINIILYYITYICEMVGLTQEVKLLVSSIPYFINAILSCCPLWYLDRVPRKSMTILGSTTLSVAMISISIIMVTTGKKVDPIHGNKALIWIVPRVPGIFVLVLCFLFVGVFSLTIACIPWIYTNELLPARSKPNGFPICMATGWIMNFTITMTCPLLMENLQWGIYLFFGGVTLILSSVIMIFFPETKEVITSQSHKTVNDLKEPRLSLEKT
ncbi:MFS, Sugar transporter [Nakaseomyces bracarensis]|uniref:MFS, Sugar transporter n=1 Tax=Nakaseomyces bracarensis TaxID=273131 RepID=A0ABR4NP95_9SACH